MIKLSKTKETKIASWNVNGIRAIHRKGNLSEILSKDFDILCFQETKATPTQLEKDILNPPNYKSWFNWPKEKKGYSGVALYSKEEPFRIVYGLPKDGNLTTKTLESQDKNWGSPNTREEEYALNFDDQGRIITAYYINYVLINCYFPNGGRNQENLDYKLNFFEHFHKYIETLDKAGHVVIWTGDVNVAHKEIDLARPKENQNSTGFLPEERAWLDKITQNEWIDIFRYLNPDTTDAYTYWDTITRARDRNVGWRIDYFFISKKYIDMVKNMYHMTDFMGSDHCPIVLEIEEPDI